MKKKSQLGARLASSFSMAPPLPGPFEDGTSTRQHCNNMYGTGQFFVEADYAPLEPLAWSLSSNLGWTNGQGAMINAGFPQPGILAAWMDTPSPTPNPKGFIPPILTTWDVSGDFPTLLDSVPFPGASSDFNFRKLNLVNWHGGTVFGSFRTLVNPWAYGNLYRFDVAPDGTIGTSPALVQTNSPFLANGNGTWLTNDLWVCHAYHQPSDALGHPYRASYLDLNSLTWTLFSDVLPATAGTDPYFDTAFYQEYSPRDGKVLIYRGNVRASPGASPGNSQPSNVMALHEYTYANGTFTESGKWNVPKPSTANFVWGVRTSDGRAAAQVGRYNADWSYTMELYHDLFGSPALVDVIDDSQNPEPVTGIWNAASGMRPVLHVGPQGSVMMQGNSDRTLWQWQPRVAHIDGGPADSRNRYT